MALNIFGNDPSTTFESEQVTAISGETQVAVMWRGSVNFTTSAVNVFLFRCQYIGSIYVSGTQLLATIRAASGTNGTLEAASASISGTEYTVFAVLDGGFLRVYLNGVEVANEARESGILSFNNTPWAVAGSNVEGKDVATNEVAYWLGSAPSAADIADYPNTKTTAQFSTPPTNSWIMLGDGIATEIVDTNGNNSLLQTTGPTSGENAPTLDGAVTPSDLTLDYIGGVSVSPSTVFCFSALESSDSTGSLTVSGTYIGETPLGVRIRTGSGAFKELTGFAASGGNWSGTTTLDVGYGLEYSDINDAEITSVAGISTGDEWLVIGQSNAAGQIGADGDTMPTSLPAGSMLYKVNSSGVHTLNPAPAQDYHWQLALARLSIYTGRPIVYTNQAVGGTKIATWLTGGSSRTTMDTNLSSAGLTASNTGRKVIWWQGESDGALTPAEYRDSLITLKNQIASSYGATTWFVTPIISLAGSAHQGALDAIYIDDDIKLGAVMDDIKEGSDNLHVRQPDQAEIIANRLVQSIYIYFNDKYRFDVPRQDVSTANPVNLSISGAPDGTHEVELTSGGEVVFSGDVSFVSGSATVNVPLLTGSSVSGKVTNSSGDAGAVISDITE